MFATPVVSNDSNWAGYIIASDLQNPQPTVTSISSSYIVPPVTINDQIDTFTAVWIGIGGFFDTTLIQAGTEMDSIGGQADYSAWYELLPAFSITIPTINVSPGDVINTTIRLVDSAINEWSIYIADQTSNQVFQSNFLYHSSQLSAEWIVERPVAGRRLATLANVGSVTLANCETTVGLQTGNISSFPSVQSVMYGSLQNTTGLTQLTVVSDLLNGGSSFIVYTDLSVIPELPAWAVLPIAMGHFLFAVVIRRSRNTGNRKL